MNLILLFSGIILLTISGNELVKGSVAIAQFFRVSKLVIGTTIVSLGTSAPELLVSLDAALKGSASISLGNVIGSNLANIGLVLGLTAMILPIPLTTRSIRNDWIVMIIASALLYLFLVNDSVLTLAEGLIFVIMLALYMFYSVKKGRKTTELHTDELNAVYSRRVGIKRKDFGALFSRNHEIPLLLGFILVLVACAGLVIGAELLVRGATGIARSLGVSERMIGLTIIAVGTSLPELATSVMAAIRKEMDISIGNIIGSNIFNIFGILGVTAMVIPIRVDDSKLFTDIFWTLGISFLLIFMIIPFIRKKYQLPSLQCVYRFFVSRGTEMKAQISRKEGMVLLFIFVVYVIWVFIP